MESPPRRPVPPAVRALTPAVAAVLGGGIVTQMQASWGWAAILLVSAALWPLAIWWASGDQRANSVLTRVVLPTVAGAYLVLTVSLSLFGQDMSVLWKLAITTPVATAALAVLLLVEPGGGRGERILGVALMGVGVAVSGLGVALITSDLSTGIALVVSAAAGIIFGAVAIVGSAREHRLAEAIVGTSMLWSGVALILRGGPYYVFGYPAIAVGVVVAVLAIAQIVNVPVQPGVGATFTGAVGTYFGVMFIVGGDLLLGVGVVVGGLSLITIASSGRGRWLLIGLVGFCAAMMVTGIGVINQNIGLGLAIIGFGIAGLAFIAHLVGRAFRENVADRPPDPDRRLNGGDKR